MHAGDMLNVSSSTSTMTGLAPRYRTTSAVAVKVYDGTMTSSPGPTPNASNAKCKPEVAELTAIVWISLPPKKSAKSASNFLVLGPVVTQPERRASTTSAISSSPISGNEKGKKLEVILFNL